MDFRQRLGSLCGGIGWYPTGEQLPHDPSLYITEQLALTKGAQHDYINRFAFAVNPPDSNVEGMSWSLKF
jgi:hypothetical protein